VCIRSGATPDTVRYVHGDGHVHLYPQYDTGAFFRRGLGLARRFDAPLLLLLAEADGYDCFRALSADVESPALSGLSFERTAEPSSLRVRDKGRDGPGVFLISGRQLLSRENLEVLVIGLEPGHELYSSRPKERSTEELTRQGLEAGAITVLPWGFGKWLGERGRHVRELARRPENQLDPLFFLGDILARCWPWPAPDRRLAGTRVLPGTDILPLRGFERRLGEYGFRVRGRFHEERPSGSLVTMLRRRLPVEPVGEPDRPLRTIFQQLRYRLRARERRPGA